MNELLELAAPVEIGFHSPETEAAFGTTTVHNTTSLAPMPAMNRKSWRYAVPIQQFYALRMVAAKQFTVAELVEYVMHHAAVMTDDGVLDSLRRLRKQKKLNYRIINARKGEYEFLEVEHGVES